jgi:hypothetical protein
MMFNFKEKNMTAHQKSDRYFKWFLIVAALYFFGHMGAALATSTPPTIQCWNNGFGTIQCAPI